MSINAHSYSHCVPSRFPQQPAKLVTAGLDKSLNSSFLEAAVSGTAACHDCCSALQYNTPLHLISPICSIRLIKGLWEDLVDVARPQQRKLSDRLHSLCNLFLLSCIPPHNVSLDLNLPLKIVCKAFEALCLF